MREAEILYFTFASFEEMVGGDTSNYYDLHLSNIASVSDGLRVLHLGTEDALVRKTHPRLDGVEHWISAPARITPASLVHWSTRSALYIKRPTLIYLPYASPTSLIAAAWKVMSKVKIATYLRFTWSPAAVTPRETPRLTKRILDKFCTSIAIKSADWIGAGSDDLRSEVLSAGAQNSRVSITTNFVDVARLPIKSNYSQSGPRPKVAFVGSLRSLKRVDWLIHASHRLPIEVHIAGDGPERRSLEKKAVGLPVEFHGRIPNERIGKYLLDKDIFVFPSMIEGVPKALLEAMAVGLPCLGCQVPGVASWLKEGRGYLCENNLQDFIKQLDFLCANENVRLACGQAASKYSRTYHSPAVALNCDNQWLTKAFNTLQG